MTEDAKTPTLGKDEAVARSDNRAEWQRPAHRKLEMREAENSFNSGADYGIVS
jgi:hypothetical protein